MSQEQPPYEQNDESGQSDQSDLDSTQPSPSRAPRQLDWRPPDYRSTEAEPPDEPPPVRRMAQPRPRRRPPTEGAPAWVVGLGVGALLAVVVLLGVAFVLSRPSSEAEPTATAILVTPTDTLVPRPTFTPVPEATTTSAPAPETTDTEPSATTPSSEAPDAISVGGYARVVVPSGLSFRQTASTSGDLVQVLDNDTVLEVIDGPQEADGYTWWKLRKLDDDKEGWSAAGSGEDVFLEPAPAP